MGRLGGADSRFRRRSRWNASGGNAAAAPAIPVLHLDGFDGPMDLLLDLAERQRIDLGRISVLALVEQFAAAMDCLAARVPVERRADWVVVATRLVLLRSKLLFPASPEAVAAAEREAAREIERLESVRFVRAAAAWLLARPQLGHAVFARPTAGPDPRAASYMALMEACLTVLRGREGEPDAAEAVYRPPIPDLFRVPGALVRMRAKLAAIAGAEPLEVFLPLMPRGHHEPGAGRPLGRGQHLHGRARTRACGRAGAPSGRGLSLDHRYPCRRPGSGAGARACIAVPPSPGFRAGPWAATPQRLIPHPCCRSILGGKVARSWSQRRIIQGTRHTPWTKRRAPPNAAQAERFIRRASETDLDQDWFWTIADAYGVD